LPVAGDAAWQNELAGLLGIGHDDAQPDDYCAAVGVFSGLHVGPRKLEAPLIEGAFGTVTQLSWSRDRGGQRFSGRWLMLTSSDRQ